MMFASRLGRRATEHPLVGCKQEFVAAMEDVLRTYEEPYDPARPVICMDETGKQLVGETYS